MIKLDFKSFERTGVFTNGITVDELIENLQGYKGMYGNQPIRFDLEGDGDCHVQFDYFRNALTISVYEEDPR